jgi:hypothetical protein
MNFILFKPFTVIMDMSARYLADKECISIELHNLFLPELTAFIINYTSILSTMQSTLHTQLGSSFH